jgi:uncharacterized membrane protein HdeD (DUF308 family)
VTRIGLSIDHKSARERLADYLRREQFVPEADADRRAEEMVSLLGGGEGPIASAGAALAENWWLFTLRGVLALLFGIFALFMPGPALAALVLVFGVWAFIDGIQSLALAVTGWRSWQLVLAGLVGIGIGLLTFFRPGITALGLFAALAAWSIARGVLEIVVAIEMRRHMSGSGWLIVGGIASILFGVLMVALPAAGVLAIVWLIAIYAITFGIIMLVLSGRLYRLRPAARGHEPRRIDLGRQQPA